MKALEKHLEIKNGQVNFLFTTKSGYLEFRKDWRTLYKKHTEVARNYRKALTGFRNAGGFGRKSSVGDLESAKIGLDLATKALDAINPRKYAWHTLNQTGRMNRNLLMEIRTASKIHAQSCFVANREKDKSPVLAHEEV